MRFLVIYKAFTGFNNAINYRPPVKQESKHNRPQSVTSWSERVRMANEHITARLKPLMAYIESYQAHKREAIFEEILALIRGLRYKEHKKQETRRFYNEFKAALDAYTIDMVGKPEYDELRIAVNPKRNLFIFAIERNSLHPRGKISFESDGEW